MAKNNNTITIRRNSPPTLPADQITPEMQKVIDEAEAPHLYILPTLSEAEEDEK